MASSSLKEEAPPPPAPRRRSLLPSWLLESEAALASLNDEQKRTSEKLRELRSSLKAFDEMTAAAPAAAAAAAAKEEPLLPPKVPPPHAWPVDVVRQVTRFFDGEELVRYGASSKKAGAFLAKNDDLWRSAYESHGLEGWPSVRLIALCDEESTRIAVTAWCQLRRRARDYLRERRLGADSALAATVDGRRRVLVALRALTLVTATTDLEAHREFLDTAPAPLARLLEETDAPSAVHELAAAALANLLASPLASAAARDPLVSRTTAAALRSLLTSPSARVLTVATEHERHLGLQGSTYCQGVACKHAARALVNLALPEKAIAMPPEDAYPRRSKGATMTNWGNDGRKDGHHHNGHDHVVEEDESDAGPPGVFRLGVTTFHASGGLKSEARVDLRLRRQSHFDTRKKSDDDFLLDGRGREESDGLSATDFGVKGAAHLDAHGHLVLRFALTYGDEEDRENDDDQLTDVRRLVEHRRRQQHDGHVALLLWQSTDLLKDGLFGVWEICSPSNSFVLRRGGVCRANVQRLTD
mmetsp:Transcript_27277/g.88136  ORF Transcript_27277/g.88136 Transcript_27277/m.88136 type:complete len:529 (+) Transcript_27277:9-1595(+)